MSGLTCGTNELSLFSCSSNTSLGTVETTTSCRHADDASVRCQGLATGTYVYLLHINNLYPQHTSHVHGPILLAGYGLCMSL